MQPIGNLGSTGRGTTARGRAWVLSVAMVVGALSSLAIPISAAAPAPGEWGEPGPIGTGAFSLYRGPDLAVGAGGDAFAGWIAFNGTGMRAVAAHYMPGSGWSEARYLDDGVSDSYEVRVAADGKGNGLAVWINTGMLWANRFVAGNGWGLAHRINTGTVYDLTSAAMDRDGNALVAWNEWNASGVDMIAAFFSPTQGWLPQVMIGPDRDGYASEMDVAFGRNGEAFVLWQESEDGSTLEIWGARLDPVAGWQAATLVGGNATWGGYFPQVSANAQGDACIAWLAGGIRQEVWASRYTPSAGFESPSSLEPQDSFAEGEPPAVAADAQGTCTVAWSTRQGAFDDILAGRQPVGGSWGAPVLLDVGDGSALSPSAAADDQGNTIVVWRQSGTSGTGVQANWFVGGAGWAGALPVERLDYVGAGGARVGLDAAGNAVAVWGSFHDSVSELWSSARAEDFSPALDVSSPLPGATTNQSSIWVMGTTEPGASVVAGGARAAVDAGGAFRLLVPLEPGLNSIVVTATDAAGNDASTTVGVVFDDPRPGLEQAVAAAEAALANALIEANASSARLAAVEANASATADDLATARAEAAAANASVAALQGALSVARADVVALGADLNATRSDLASSVQAQSRLQADLAGMNQTVTNLQAQPAPPGDALPLVLAAAALAVAVAGVVLNQLGRRKPPQPSEP